MIAALAPPSAHWITRSHAADTAIIGGGKPPDVPTAALPAAKMQPIDIVLICLRARVDVDLDRLVVTSTRAFRRTVVSTDDIVNVRVPPWGPVALMLRPGVRKRGGGICPGQVLTGIYASHRGDDGVANAIGSLLGVPVLSVWPGVRSDERPDSDQSD